LNVEEKQTRQKYPK